MFPWWIPTAKHTKNPQPARQRRNALRLEALEGRDCPSTSIWDAPVGAGDGSSGTALMAAANPGLALSLSATAGPNGTVTVSGQVSGTGASGGLTVTLSGVVSGTVTTNADGTFTFTGPASGPGQIQASVTDAASNTASSTCDLIPKPPTIDNFEAVYRGNNTWTFRGVIRDANAEGLVVTLSGLSTLDDNHASATVQADGTFSYTITLQPGESGGVTAECVDWWGQSSNEATAYVIG